MHVARVLSSSVGHVGGCDTHHGGRVAAGTRNHQQYSWHTARHGRSGASATSKAVGVAAGGGGHEVRSGGPCCHRISTALPPAQSPRLRQAASQGRPQGSRHGPRKEGPTSRPRPRARGPKARTAPADCVRACVGVRWGVGGADLPRRPLCCSPPPPKNPRQCRGLVQVHHQVKLGGQAGLEVVALALGLGGGGGRLAFVTARPCSTGDSGKALQHCQLLANIPPPLAPVGGR